MYKRQGKEVAAFIDAIVNDKETPLNVYDGLKPVLMGLAAKKSSEEHRPCLLYTSTQGGMEYVSSGNGTEVTVFLPAIYDMPEEGRKN